MSKEKDMHTAPSEIAESGAVCTLEEICIACQVEEGWVTALVAHGVIDPILGRGKTGQRFAAASIMRVAKAKRLERDLSLNTPGVALVLDLLDEIERLRNRLRALPTGTATSDE